MELILERTELREDCTVGTLSVIKRVDDEYLAGGDKGLSVRHTGAKS